MQHEGNKLSAVFAISSTILFFGELSIAHHAYINI